MKKISNILLAILSMGKIRKISAIFAIMGILGLISPLSSSALLLQFSDPSGLSATGDFTLENSNTLQIVLTNTSTDYPDYFEGDDLNSNILLTSIAFNLGSGISILGGSVIVTPGSMTSNFDKIDPQLPEGADISVEWGYGNDGTTGFGSLVNYVSAMEAGTFPFQEVDSTHLNLDGSTSLNGPQGGLISNTLNQPVGLGGLGAVLDSVTITLDLSGSITDLSFLDNGVIVEFGSDAAFVPVPEPTTMLLFGTGLIGLAALGRKKFRKNNNS